MTCASVSTRPFWALSASSALSHGKRALDRELRKLWGIIFLAEPILPRAKWAVGAHVLQLHNGQILGDDDSTADARTAIGIDQPRKLLFLAIAERISQPRMLHILADLGARDGFLLDGGGSSAMGIGQGSTGIPATILLGGGRPLATYIGVRAPPCRNSAGSCD